MFEDRKKRHTPISNSGDSSSSSSSSSSSTSSSSSSSSSSSHSSSSYASSAYLLLSEFMSLFSLTSSASSSSSSCLPSLLSPSFYSSSSSSSSPSSSSEPFFPSPSPPYFAVSPKGMRKTVDFWPRRRQFLSKLLEARHGVSVEFIRYIRLNFFFQQFFHFLVVTTEGSEEDAFCLLLHKWWSMTIITKSTKNSSSPASAASTPAPPSSVGGFLEEEEEEEKESVCASSASAELLGFVCSLLPTLLWTYLSRVLLPPQFLHECHSKRVDSLPPLPLSPSNNKTIDLRNYSYSSSGWGEEDGWDFGVQGCEMCSDENYWGLEKFLGEVSDFGRMCGPVLMRWPNCEILGNSTTTTPPMLTLEENLKRKITELMKIGSFGELGEKMEGMNRKVGGEESDGSTRCVRNSSGVGGERKKRESGMGGGGSGREEEGRGGEVEGGGRIHSLNIPVKEEVCWRNRCDRFGESVVVEWEEEKDVATGGGGGVGRLSEGLTEEEEEIGGKGVNFELGGGERQRGTESAGGLQMLLVERCLKIYVFFSTLIFTDKTLNHYSALIAARFCQAVLAAKFLPISPLHLEAAVEFGVYEEEEEEEEERFVIGERKEDGEENHLHSQRRSGRRKRESFRNCDLIGNEEDDGFVIIEEYLRRYNSYDNEEEEEEEEGQTLWDITTDPLIIGVTRFVVDDFLLLEIGRLLAVCTMAMMPTTKSSPATATAAAAAASTASVALSPLSHSSSSSTFSSSSSSIMKYQNMSLSALWEAVELGLERAVGEMLPRSYWYFTALRQLSAASEYLKSK